MMGLIQAAYPWPRRDCFVKWALRFLTTVILTGLGVCVYWVLLDRKVPVEIQKGEVILYQEQSDHSWVFIVKWTGILHRRCGGISNRWIVDGFRLPLVDIPYPAEAEPTQIGEVFSWEVPVHVPAYFVSTGHVSGQYRARFLHACNPLQERIFPIISTPPTVPFALPMSDDHNDGRPSPVPPKDPLVQGTPGPTPAPLN
jgi:hypothetical protein